MIIFEPSSIKEQKRKKETLPNLSKQLAKSRIENMELKKMLSILSADNAKTKIEIMKIKKEVNG